MEGPKGKGLRRLPCAVLASALLTLAACGRAGDSAGAEARLIVHVPPVSGGYELFRETPEGFERIDADARLPAGRHVLHARPLDPTGPGPERLEAHLSSDKVHVWSLVGVSVEVTATLEGRFLRTKAAPRLGEVVHIEVDGRAVDVPLDASLSVSAHGGIDGELAQGVVVANPYDVGMAIETEAEGRAYAFLLAPVATRFVPVASGATLTVRALGEGADEIRAVSHEVPEGASLALLGGLTTCRWVEEDPAKDRLVPPAALVRLDVQPRDLLLPLMTNDAYPEGRLLLGRTRPGTGRSFLVALSSGALSAGEPRARAPISHAPDLEVRLVRAGAGDLGAESLATGAPGAVFVAQGVARDLAGDRALHAKDEAHEVVEAAFAERHLLLRDRRGGIFALGAEGLEPVLDLLDPGARIVGEGANFYVLGGPALPRLIAWHPGEDPVVLLGREGPAVSALAQDEDGTLYLARGSRIEQYRGGEETEFLLELPEAENVYGLLRVRGGLLLSTREAVSLFDGEVVFPVLAGAGGTLHRTTHGVLLHDVASHDVLELRGPAVARQEGDR